MSSSPSKSPRGDGHGHRPCLVASSRGGWERGAAPPFPARSNDVAGTAARSERSGNRARPARARSLPSFAPAEIKQLRERHHVSQPVFARYLSTSESTVEKWEAGTKKPSGLALKLLTVVQKHGLEVLA